MQTLIWGIDGFRLVDLMTEQHGYNTQYFLSHPVEPILSTIFPDNRKPHSPRLSVRLDYCCVHHSKASDPFSLKTVLFEGPIHDVVLSWHP
jgi:hypothetical protein